MPLDNQEFVERLATPGAKAVLREFFGEESCLNSTRTLYEVCRNFDVDAKPLVVRMMAFSAAFAERAKREGMPESREQLMEWTNEPGTYSIGVGYSSIIQEPNRWSGHLVLRVNTSLLDPTACQANRPDGGIELPDMLIVPVVPDRFWTERAFVVATGSNGCIVRYESRPQDLSYLNTPPWSLDREPERRAARLITTMMRLTAPL